MTDATAGTTTGGAATAAEHLLHLLSEMLRIRRFEERCVELYSRTAIRGFLHLAIGEEACAVGVTEALSPEDAIVATYREHGHAIARGLSMRVTMAELEGKVEGCSVGGEAARCTCSMPQRASMVATPSSPEVSRSRWASPSPTTCRDVAA